MSNNYFNNDNNKTNSPVSSPAILPVSNLNDISDFFDNYKTMNVQHITLTDNSKDYISISLNNNSFSSEMITVENTEKNLNYKYVFNILENRGIFLKSTIPHSKIIPKKKALIQKIQRLASLNHLTIPSKAGLFHTLSSDIQGRMTEKISFACSNDYPALYPNSYVNVNFNNLNIVVSPKINFHSFDGVFLFVLRYTSLMMPLSLPTSLYSFNIKFPYIVTFSSQSSINTLRNLLKNYLLVFRNAFTYSIPDSIAINVPFNMLNTIIQNRTNNVLLIDGIADTENIRNENLNLLKDYFTQSCTDRICCIISNTVQQKLSDASYININFDEIINNNIVTDFFSLDSVFINWLTSTKSDTPFFKQYNEIFNGVFSKYANNISNPNAQQAISTLLSVFIFIRKIFIMNVNDCPDNELEDRFFHYLLPFFENHSKQENTNAVLEQFKSNINSMIYKRQLHVIPNDKTNKTLPYQALNRLVYKGNGTIIITDEVLRYICQISNINISLLKKSLVQNGYLSSSESLNVSKISLYPPGSPSVRQYAYIIDDAIINEKLLAHLNYEQFFSLSFASHTTSDINGIILGYDIKNEPVIWSYKKLATAHLMLTGNSGIGKTTLISNLIQRILSKKEDRIIIFDISGSYINNSSLKDISNVYNRRLPINPFISYKNENKNQYIHRICRNLNNCFNLQPSSYSQLQDIIDKAFDENTGLNTNILSSLAYDCKSSLITRICHFIINIIQNSDHLTWSELSDEKITILNLDDSFEEYTITTEFLLRDMYDYRQSSANHTLFAVVDEIQNLVRKDSNAIIQILSQGREKKIGLILSTQSFKTIPAKFRSMFLQTSVSVFFQPELTSTDMITKLIRSDNSIEKVSSILKKLGQGEFLIYGMMETPKGVISSDSLIYASANLSPREELESMETQIIQSPNTYSINTVDISFTITF